MADRGRGNRTIVGWANRWSGDVWCRGEHDTLEDLLADMGPMQRHVVRLEELTLGQAERLEASLICSTCGRPVQQWYHERQ